MIEDKVKWCVNCQKNIVPIKYFSVFGFIVLCFLPVFAIVYLIVYFMRVPYLCPICHHKHCFLSVKREKKVVEKVVQPVIKINKNRYCTNCGIERDKNASFCPSCGIELI